MTSAIPIPAVNKVADISCTVILTSVALNERVVKYHKHKYKWSLHGLLTWNSADSTTSKESLLTPVEKNSARAVAHSVRPRVVSAANERDVADVSSESQQQQYLVTCNNVSRYYYVPVSFRQYKELKITLPTTTGVGGRCRLHQSLHDSTLFAYE